MEKYNYVPIIIKFFNRMKVKIFTKFFNKMKTSDSKNSWAMHSSINKYTTIFLIIYLLN